MFQKIGKLIAISRSSLCQDKKVGCMLFDKQANLLSYGTNVAGKNCPIDGCQKQHGKECQAEHAEINALKACTDEQRSKIHYCLCTLEPCRACTKALMDAGVKNIQFLQYTNPAKSGKAMARSEFVGWQKLDIKPEEVIASIRAYHERLGYPVVNCSTEQQYEQARNICLAMFQEVAELTESMDWKPWREYNGRRKVDKDNLLEEAGDILFFIDSMLIIFGLSWEQLFIRMSEKVYQVNQRIDNGYHK